MVQLLDRMLSGSCFPLRTDLNCANSTTYSDNLSKFGLSIGIPCTMLEFVYTKNNSTPANNANFDICFTLSR